MKKINLLKYFLNKVGKRDIDTPLSLYLLLFKIKSFI